MQVVMSNPGLHLAVIGNPGPRKSRRASTRRRSLKGHKMAATKKQRAKALIKATRAQGRTPSAKLRRQAGMKVRKTKKRRQPKRRAAARRYSKRARGYKIAVRRRPGKRIKNRKFGRKTGIRTGRKGTVAFKARRGPKRKTFKTIATNPGRRRRRRRRSRRRNPAGATIGNSLSVRGWTKGLTTLPSNVTGMLKGKGVITNLLFATGGAVGGIVGGNFVAAQVSRFLPAGMTQGIANRAISAGFAYTSGYALGTLLIKNPKRRTAFITGSAAAAVVNLLMPGTIQGMLAQIPGIGPMMANLPGMSGYVEAPGYQGVGSYVEAPSYQGVGYADDMLAAYGDDALAGELGAYVEAPSYQGVGMYAQSHLDQ